MHASYYWVIETFRNVCNSIDMQSVNSVTREIVVVVKGLNGAPARFSYDNEGKIRVQGNYIVLMYSTR